jgi:hypothetical protein
MSRRVGRSSLVLGAALLVGSALSVVATGNTPPTITNVGLSSAVANEGEQLTLTGSFTDPDAGDSHTVQIDWHVPGEPQQKIELAPGQTSFQTSRKFMDDRAPQQVRVSVLDHQLVGNPNDNAEGNGYDTEYLTLEVKNVAPSFAKGIEVKRFVGQPGKVAIEGTVADPGADTLEVTVTWDGVQQIPLRGSTPCQIVKRQFRCEHTYPAAPHQYNVTLRVRDDDGGQQSTGVRVQIP